MESSDWFTSCQSPVSHPPICPLPLVPSLVLLLSLSELSLSFSLLSPDWTDKNRKLNPCQPLSQLHSGSETLQVLAIWIYLTCPCLNTKWFWAPSILIPCLPALGFNWNEFLLAHWLLLFAIIKVPRQSSKPGPCKAYCNSPFWRFPGQVRQCPSLLPLGRAAAGQPAYR